MDGGVINILVIITVIVIAIVKSVNKTKTETAQQQNRKTDMEDVFEEFTQPTRPVAVKPERNQKAIKSIEFTPRKKEVSQMPDVVAEKEKNEYLTEIVSDFDLTRAVIYAEILKPKFEDNEL